MKFSIITPSFNNLNFLRESCKSLVSQNVDYEHIIIDNNSTDGTVNWLKNSNNQNLRYVVEKDQGMYDAINKGINLASGDIIFHLNCDEMLLPEVLKKIRKIFINYKNIDYVVGNFYMIDNRNIYPRFTPKPDKNLILANYNYNHTCTIFYKKKIFNYLKFNKNYKNIGDCDFLLRLLNTNFKFKKIRDFISVYTFRNNAISFTNYAKNEIDNFFFQKRQFILKKIYFKIIFKIFQIYELFFSNKKNILNIEYPNYINKKKKNFFTFL